MASISGINTKWWSNELRSNWAIELSGFAQFNWSPTTQERRTRTLPNTCWADSWIERTRDADILGSQAGKQGEGGNAQRSDGAWRIWARSCEESEHRRRRFRQISHLTRVEECALQSPPAARALCPRVKTKMSKISSAFRKPKYLNEFLRTTALLGVRNV